MKGALVSLADVRDPVHCCCLGVVLSRITRSQWDNWHLEDKHKKSCFLVGKNCFICFIDGTDKWQGDPISRTGRLYRCVWKSHLKNISKFAHIISYIVLKPSTIPGCYVMSANYLWQIFRIPESLNIGLLLRAGTWAVNQGFLCKCFTQLGNQRCLNKNSTSKLVMRTIICVRSPRDLDQ